MAKKVDTRNAEGRGITYTEYDTKVVDWAKAPKTSLDNKWKIPKVTQVEKPGEVKYYGAEFADEANSLNEKRYAAYSRRQSNEYIRAGAAAPNEVVNPTAVEGKILQQAKTEYGGRRDARGQGGIQATDVAPTFAPDSVERQTIKDATTTGSFNVGMTPGAAKGDIFRVNTFRNATTSEDEGFK